LRQLDRWIKDRMPEVAAINDAVFYLFKMCLASLIHHREWLNESLHSESPIRMTSFWYEDIPLANHVTTKFPWTRTSDTPEFTGIPIDVLYMAKIEEQNAIIARLEERLIQDNNHVVSEITQHIDTALDDRAVGGESFSMGRDIIKKLDTLITRSEIKTVFIRWTIQQVTVVAMMMVVVQLRRRLSSLPLKRIPFYKSRLKMQQLKNEQKHLLRIGRRMV